MLLQQTGETLSVTGLEGADQRVVLAGGSPPVLQPHDREIADPVEADVEMTVHLDQRRIARRGDDRQVERLVGREIGGAVLGVERLRHLVAIVDDAANVAVGRGAAGDVAAKRLELGVDRQHVGDLLIAGLHHHGAAVRQEIDQPLHRQDLERIPQRGSRHVEGLGDGPLPDALARLQPVVDDQVANVVGDLHGKRFRRDGELVHLLPSDETDVSIALIFFADQAPSPEMRWVSFNSFGIQY